MRTYLSMCEILLGCLLTPILAEAESGGAHLGLVESHFDSWDLLGNDRIGDLAIDRLNDKLYWTYYSSIYRSNPDGSDSEHWVGPLLDEFESLYEWRDALWRFFIGIEGPSLHLSMWMVDGGDQESRFSIVVSLDDWTGVEHPLNLVNPIYWDGQYNGQSDIHDYDDIFDDRIETMEPVERRVTFALDGTTGQFYWMDWDGVLRMSSITDPETVDTTELLTLELDQREESPVIDLIAHNGSVYWATNDHEIFRWKWNAEDGSFAKIIDAHDIANPQTAVEPTSLGTLKASE